MAHITFVHGIGNKTAPDELLNDWKIGLEFNDGVDLDALGVTTSMVYWADLLYPSPAAAQTAQESTLEAVDGMVDAQDADLSWLDDVPADERAFVESLGHKLGMADVSATPDEVADEPIEEGTPLEAVPLPPWLKKRLMRVLLRDVHHFLYDAEFSPRLGETYKIRTEIRARMLKGLTAADSQPGPHILFGHSLGSVIAYDALTSIDDAPAVDALVTAGSPLGISEVRDGLTPPWTAQDGWPAKRLTDRCWWNVFDALDPVCGFTDRKIAEHYQRAGQIRVADIGVDNGGKWRHSISKYLGQPQMHSILNGILQ
jgi:hypothetical protein